MSRALFTGYRTRILDADGKPSVYPLRISFYHAGTTTQKPVYSASTGGASLGVYVNLDATGWGPAGGIWLDPGAYKAVLERDEGETGTPNWLSQWVTDDIPGAPDAVLPDPSAFVVLPSVAALRSYAVLSGTADITGYSDLDDGGQGRFVYDAVSTAADDGGAVLRPVVIPAGSPGRWKRVTGGTDIDVRWFGAVSSSGECASNILNAETFAARMDSENCATLVFGPGIYHLSGVVQLGELSLVPGTTTERPLRYRIESGATLSGSGGLHFGKGVDVNSSGYVGDRLSMSHTYRGTVMPEWWGADPTSTLYSTTAWENMLASVTYGDYAGPRCGASAIVLTGRYVLASGSHDVPACSTSPAGYPVYRPMPGSVVNASFTDRFDIRGVDDSFQASGWLEGVDKCRLYVPTFNSRWADLSYVSGLLAVHTAFAAGSGMGEVLWDTPFTFDGDYTPVSSSWPAPYMAHTMGRAGRWYIGNHDVRPGSFDAPARQVVLFNGDSETGTFIPVSSQTVPAAWFGAVGTGAEKKMQHAFRSAAAGPFALDFQGARTTVASQVVCYLTGYQELTIRNMDLMVMSQNPVTGIVASGPDTTRMSLEASTIRVSAGSTIAALMTGRIDIRACALEGGMLFMQPKAGLTLSGSRFLAASVQAAPQNSCYMSLSGNTFHHTQLVIPSDSTGSFGYFSVSGNTFLSNTVSQTNPFFITLHSNVPDSYFPGGSITGNVYTSLALEDTWYSRNVGFTGSTFRNTPDVGHNHNLVVKDETSTKQPSTVYWPGDPLNFVSKDLLTVNPWGYPRILQTEGYFVIDTTATPKVTELLGYPPNTLGIPGVDTSSTVVLSATGYGFNDDPGSSYAHPVCVTPFRISAQWNTGTGAPTVAHPDRRVNLRVEFLNPTTHEAIDAIVCAYRTLL